MSMFDNIDPDLNYFNSENQCTYFDVESIKDFVYESNNINIIHLNIRSANKNLDEFIVNLRRIKINFKIIVLTETWLNSSSDWLDVPGYHAFHSIREGRAGGGVTILVSCDLSAELLPALTLNVDCHESVAVNVSAGGQALAILGTYRPPCSSLQAFNESYFGILSSVGRNRTLVVLGDFNVDLICESPSSAVHTFIDQIRYYHLIPLINLPTRKTINSSSCVDHIYVSTLSPCHSGVLDLSVTDHCAVFCSIPGRSDVDGVSKTIRFRDHSAENLANFKNEIESSLQSFNVYDRFDVLHRFEIFNNLLFRLYDSSFPVQSKTLSSKRIGNPWMTPDLLRCVSEKHRLHRLALNDGEYLDDFRTYRNNLCNSIKRAKMAFYNNKFEHAIKDTKATWKTINGILKPNSQSRVIKLRNGDGVESEPSGVANIFGDYFSSVASDLASKIPVCDFDPISNVERVSNSFVFFETNRDEINKIIQSFPSKRSHLHSIPSFIYKHISSVISPIFSDLINLSVAAGVFPNFMKVARLVPIHKSGPRVDKENYRPISTLPFLSKVYERLIHARLMKYFLKYNLLYSDQYGFLKNKSTTDAILRFTDCCYSNFNRKEFLISVFLDFSRAFDTIDHVILCRKLEQYGVRGSMNSLFKSYLGGRLQYVDIGGSSSRSSEISCSVPQGSILGPLLFLIYINDMHRCTNLSIVHFADDSTVFVGDPCLRSLEQRVNRELNSIDRWLCANRLSLNVKKSSFTIYTNNPINKFF